MSALSISLRSNAWPSGERRLHVTDFLLRATTGHHKDFPCGFSRPHCRIGSPRPGILDLDHLGAEVAQQLPAERAGQQLPQFDDTQVVQR